MRLNVQPPAPASCRLGVRDEQNEERSCMYLLEKEQSHKVSKVQLLRGECDVLVRGDFLPHMSPLLI